MKENFNLTYLGLFPLGESSSGKGMGIKMKIGGNVEAVIQVMSTEKNEYGEEEPVWKEALRLKGWLDLQSNDGYKFREMSAKIGESTHVFMCDYQPLMAGSREINAEDSRLLICGKVYNVLFYDNPMELNEHLEIYLKFLGGQQDGH